MPKVNLSRIDTAFRMGHGTTLKIFGHRNMQWLFLSAHRLKANLGDPAFRAGFRVIGLERPPGRFISLYCRCVRCRITSWWHRT